MTVADNTSRNQYTATSVDDFFERYEYKYDPKGRDEWRVLVQDSDGKYRGDCEDASLSVLYYVICQESWLKFWWLLITFQAELCGCETKNGGHAVLRYGDQYIDNWSKAWVERDGMTKGLGHKFWPWYKTILPTTIAIKMVMAKLRG